MFSDALASPRLSKASSKATKVILVMSFVIGSVSQKMPGKLAVLAQLGVTYGVADAADLSIGKLVVLEA